MPILAGKSSPLTPVAGGGHVFRGFTGVLRGGLPIQWWMMVRMIQSAVLIGAMLLPAGFAAAQNAPGSGFRPVDPTVGDVDPLGISQRQLNNGFGAIGQDSYTYRRTDDPSKLYYMQPGITAQFDRSQYGTYFDSQGNAMTLQQIPPNTVFFLGRPPGPPASPPPPPSPWMINGEVDGRVAAVSMMGSDGEELRPGRLSLDWQRYRVFREAGRRDVLGALDRFVPGGTPGVPQRDGSVR